MDAVIVNKKITRILLGRTINRDDNFDTVTYDHKDNPLFVDSLFTLMEQYIDLEIHKLTGITYTEYKSMTPLEKNIFLEHVNYTVSVSNYDYMEEEKRQKDEENNSKTNNDALFGLGG